MTAEQGLSNPVLIIVFGPPASGKTTLARYLAAELSLPLMTKDMIKEALFEALGCDDVAQSRRLGSASIALLWQFAEVQMAAGRSSIIECNFRARWDGPRLLSLKQRYSFDLVHILCRAQDAVLIERYRQRAGSGERHPGHFDSARILEIDAESLREQCEPLAADGTLIEVDTTDFGAVDYATLLARVRTCLGQL